MYSRVQFRVMILERQDADFFWFMVSAAFCIDVDDVRRERRDITSREQWLFVGEIIAIIDTRFLGRRLL